MFARALPRRIRRKRRKAHKRLKNVKDHTSSPMSRRMVSGKINEPSVSPALSSATRSTVSVVSISSIVSEMTTEATGVQQTELGAKHDTYFFKDGNITFLVDGTLYCVHRYFFSRDSVYFSTKFDQLDVRDHEPLSTIISLDDVEREDFETFLSVLYPIKFELLLSYDEWVSVVHLSTRWGFASLRELALNAIEPLLTPFDQLLLARAYDVDDWALAALSALCERERPIRLKEASQMDLDDFVLVATVREKMRKFGFVDTTGIERLIDATPSSDDDSASSESGVTDKEPLPPKEAVTGTGATEDSYNGTKEVSGAITSEAVNKHRKNKHSVGWSWGPLETGLVVGADGEKKKMAKKKGGAKGENTRANTAKSETIPSEGDVANTISKKNLT